KLEPHRPRGRPAGAGTAAVDSRSAPPGNCHRGAARFLGRAARGSPLVSRLAGRSDRAQRAPGRARRGGGRAQPRAQAGLAHALRLRNVHFPKELKLADAALVLVDAPCSGTGSLAREPQQKWKLTAKGVADFAARQSALLDEVAQAKAIVYATCSLLREENEAVVEAFLKRQP